MKHYYSKLEVRTFVILFIIVFAIAICSVLYNIKYSLELIGKEQQINTLLQVAEILKENKVK